MIEQSIWIILSCVGCVVGTFLSVFVGRLTERIKNELQ
jgi:hypothetical protein